MKRVFLIFFAFTGLLLLSCNKPDTQVENDPFSHISLDEKKIFKYMPYERFENVTEVIFKDSLGREKSFDIVTRRSTTTKGLNGQTYSTDVYKVLYQDVSDSTYIIEIGASGEYQASTEYVEFVDASFRAYNPFGDLYSPWIIIVAETGQALFCEYSEEVELNNQFFEDCYYNLDAPDKYIGFRKLYYNPTEGIVAFDGKEGKLWVIDRMK